MSRQSRIRIFSIFLLFSLLMILGCSETSPQNPVVENALEMYQRSDPNLEYQFNALDCAFTTEQKELFFMVVNESENHEIQEQVSNNPDDMGMIGMYGVVWKENQGYASISYERSANNDLIIVTTSNEEYTIYSVPNEYIDQMHQMFDDLVNKMQA